MWLNQVSLYVSLVYRRVLVMVKKKKNECDYSTVGQTKGVKKKRRVCDLSIDRIKKGKFF